MSAGLSGTYAINGTTLSLQPTEGRWLERSSFGIDGNGHPIYSGVRQFELRFQLESMSDLQQIINSYNSVGATGTIVMDLPQWGAADFRFYSYSGCTLREPEYGPYFEEFNEDVTLLVMNIRTQ